jgi:hypothetical protein
MDDLIRFLEVVKPLICCLQNRKALPVVWVIFLFGTRYFWTVEIDWCQYPETILLLENSGDYEDAGHKFQNDWLSWLECFRMGALVKEVCYSRNVTSAVWVGSHLTCLDILAFSAFFGRSDMWSVTLACFKMNCQKTWSMKKAHAYPEQTPGLASHQLMKCDPIPLHSHWG